MKTKSLHGTCVSINGQGVLLTGKSGSGKSATALTLLKRGHQLISDDFTTLTREGNTILATCPPSIKNLLLVNKVGLLDIKHFFGETRVANSTILKLIIHLEPNTWQNIPSRETVDFVLGVAIPKRVITIPTVLL